MTDATPLLEVRGLAKRFGGVRALAGVDLVVEAGEVHGLIGENGAGKSTLIKCLSGVHRPDAGEILWQGAPFAPAGPRAAEAGGIGVVHQELAVVARFTGAEMLHLGRRYPRRAGLVDRRAMRARARGMVRGVAPDLPLDTPVGRLSTGQCQMLEIARALASGARLIVLDEPTAALGQGEADRLHGVIAALAARGTAILYVSHRLADLRAVCGRVTVLRGGRSVATGPPGEFAHDDLVRLMSGAERPAAAPPEMPAAAAGPPRLVLRGVPFGPARAPLSLEVCAGEIVGLYGLIGAGRSGLLRALWGAGPRLGGQVSFDGAPLAGGIAERIARGIAYVPEERRAEGLVLHHSVAANATLPALRVFRAVPALPVPSAAKAARFVERLRERFAIRLQSPRMPVANLSGGNQQKLMAGRWTARHVALWLIDEPTRGVDVEAKAALHRVFRDMAAEGAAVLMASSDIEEVAALSDRVVTMREGRLTGAFPGRGATPAETIIAAAFAEGAPA